MPEKIQGADPFVWIIDKVSKQYEVNLSVQRTLVGASYVYDIFQKTETERTICGLGFSRKVTRTCIATIDQKSAKTYDDIFNIVTNNVSRMRAPDSLTLNENRIGDKAQKKLVAAPGNRAGSILKFVFSKKAFETVFAQAIVDMRDEHAEALSEGLMHKARWILVRDHLGLGLTVAAYLAATVGKKVMGVWNMIPPGGD